MFYKKDLKCTDNLTSCKFIQVSNCLKYMMGDIVDFCHSIFMTELLVTRS